MQAQTTITSTNTGEEKEVCEMTSKMGKKMKNKMAYEIATR